MDTKKNLEQSVATLNSLLRGELSAVETYDQASEKIADEPDLEENRECHSQRVDVLSSRIEELGGTPETTSGAWGAFAKLAEGGAKIFGRDAAIAVLEEGEDRGLADYRNALGQLDAQSRELIEKEVLPAQERSHYRMSLLKEAKELKSHSASGSDRLTPLLVMALVMPLLWLGGCGENRKVAISDVPEPARATIVRQANDGQITEIKRGTDDGKTCYHVSVANGVTTSHYCVDEAGNLCK